MSEDRPEKDTPAFRGQSGAPEGRYYVSFESVDAAQRATGGTVYRFQGRDERDVIVVKDQHGQNWVYVRADYQGYGQVAEKIHGRRLSENGLEAEHVASKKLEGNLGQHYVLLGRVPQTANRSSGTVEKLNDGRPAHAEKRRETLADQPKVSPDRRTNNRLTRAFGIAGAGMAGTGGAGRARLNTYEENGKLAGRRIGEIREQGGDSHQVRPQDAEQIAEATFQGKEAQSLIEKQKGRVPIAGPGTGYDRTETAEADAKAWKQSLNKTQQKGSAWDKIGEQTASVQPGKTKNR
ncbi:MAG: hypothetical protein AAGD08_21365 [Pseudomonadota bacterium]